MRPGIIGLAAVLALPLTAQGSGFALLEQNASGLGNAFAGSAASPDDASIIFYNPAGLSDLDAPQVSVSADGIDLSTRFHDAGSTLPLAGLGLLPRGATRSDAGAFGLVPSAYFALPSRTGVSFGLGVGAPFGLQTKYDDPWVGRFQGIDSELWTLNFNPSLSWRVNDWLSVGGGADYQKANAKLTNAALLGPGVEGRARLDVHDWAWGWNVGALASLPGGTRIGLSYRSRVSYDLSGTTTVTTAGGTVIPLAGGATKAALTMPDSAIASLAQKLSQTWELLADVSWTHWSRIQDVNAVNPATGLPRDILHFGFRDTWRAALGLSYHWSDELTFRGGVAWDQSPVRDALRTVRLPDNDRKWLSVGMQWRPTGNICVDAGYAHLFVSSPGVDLTRSQVGAPPSFASTVVGTYDASINIFGVQLTYRFL